MSLHLVMAVLVTALTIASAACFVLGYCLGRTDERLFIHRRARMRAQGLLARKQGHSIRL